MIFNYDRGFFGFAIPFGDLGVSVLSGADVPRALDDLPALAAELDRRMRLRIPDKYLDSYCHQPRRDRAGLGLSWRLMEDPRQDSVQWDMGDEFDPDSRMGLIWIEPSG